MDLKLGDRAWESLIPAVPHRGSLHRRKIALLFFLYLLRGHCTQFALKSMVPPRIASMSFFFCCFGVKRPSYLLLCFIWLIAMVLRYRALSFVAPALQPPQLLASFGARPWALLFIFKCLLFLFSGSGRLHLSLFIERLSVAKGGLWCSDHFCFHCPRGGVWFLVAFSSVALPKPLFYTPNLTLTCSDLLLYRH